MSKYQVTFTMSIMVEADDEFEAEDIAMEAVASIPAKDIRTADVFVDERSVDTTQIDVLGEEV